MRSFLIMLGTITDVATIIILANLTNGCMSSAVESFASMGVNQINVNVINLAFRSLGMGQAYVFYEEYTDLFGELGLSVTLSPTIKYGDDSTASTSVAGHSKQYLGIKSYELETGRNIVYSDTILRQRACVIGAYVVNELYGNAQNAIEQTPKIDGYVLKIIGMAKAQDKDNMEGGGIDDFVWIPYSVAVKMSRSANINSYTFTALDTSKADEYTTTIKDLLYEMPKGEDLHHVMTVSEMLDPLNEQTATTSGMPGGIAGISLLVADMGVVSTMLVSVTKRTRETGIRKFLGVDKGTIMRQFIIEAVVTSPMGGVIGILVGCVATTVVGAMVGVSTVPTLSTVIVSFSVSVGIGLLFGYMSTNWVANLNLINVLRGERYVSAGHHTGKTSYLNRQPPDLTPATIFLYYVGNMTENN